MPLFPVLPEVIVPGVTTGESSDSESLNKQYNAGPKVIPFKMDGTNETALFEQAHDESAPGSTLILPSGGPIKIDPVVISKQLHILGGGRFSSWFVPASNTTDPLITVDRIVDSGHGIWANYGATMEGFGIDRSGHLAGPCMHTTPNAAHLTLKDILCSFGTIGLEHHAPNATFDGLYMWDQSDCMLDMDEDGLEVTMQRVFMVANVADVDTYWRLTISEDAAGDLLGGIYGGIVVCRSNPAVTVTNGVVFTAPSLTEIPTFTAVIVVDNVNGGGPAYDLDHVQSIDLNGWGNGTNGVVRMDGAAGIQSNMRTRGGTHTYEFVGDETVGFKSRSELFTGPAYLFNGTPPDPDAFDVDDWVSGASTIAQVTDDPEVFFDLGRRSWKTLRLQGMLRQREDGDSPPQGVGTLVDGVLVVIHPNVQTNTRIVPWRQTTGLSGTPGLLQHDVADNIVGTSFTIKSTDLTDTSRVGWRFAGDKD